MLLILNRVYTGYVLFSNRYVKIIGHPESVLNGIISLKKLLVESEKANQIVKTKSMIAKEAGFESFESLHLKYPTKLTDETVESFIGATTTGKNKNLKGLMLKNFVNNMRKQESHDKTLKTEVLENTRLSYYNVTTRLVDLVWFCWFKQNLAEKNMLG